MQKGGIIIFLTVKQVLCAGNDGTSNTKAYPVHNSFLNTNEKTVLDSRMFKRNKFDKYGYLADKRL